MKPSQIEFLKKLDPDKQNGTIQSVLLDKDVEKFDFVTVLQHLLSLTVGEKYALMKENRKMKEVLKKHNLYTNDLLL